MSNGAGLRDRVRWSPALTALAAVAGSFLAASVLVFALLILELQNVRNDVRENALWAVYQLDRENGKLISALATHDEKSPDAGTDAVISRFDILYSRISLLQNGQFPDIFTRDEEFRTQFGNFKSAIDEVTPIFDRLVEIRTIVPATISQLQANFTEVAEITTRLVLIANNLITHERTVRRAYLSQLYSVLAGLVLALMVSTTTIIFVLLRQIAAIRRAGARLEAMSTELRVQAERAEAANRAKSAFLATMSHEIRTPINGVVGTAEILLGMGLAPDEHRLATTIRSCGLALVELVTDVLDFSKLEAGGVSLEAIPFDPVAEIEAASRMLEARAQEKGIVVVIAPALPPACRLRGDPVRFRQVVANLMANAVKFTETGSVIVRCGPAAIPGRLLVTVDDTGIGIDEAGRQRLFREFSQVDASITRRFGGTGLGLAISRRIVESMGGAIGVESQLSVGSRFWFEIPAPMAEFAAAPEPAHVLASLEIDDPVIEEAVRAALRYADVRPSTTSEPDVRIELVRNGLRLQMEIGHGSRLVRRSSVFSPATLVAPETIPDARQLAAAPAPAVGWAPKPSGRSLSVLVAEDNQVNQIVVTRLLAQLGHRVHLAENGAAAVEAVRTGSFDVVLMDVMMPIMDGLQATAEIRALPGPESQVPILAVTANAFQSDRAACLAAGMTGFLPKPIAKADLDAVLTAMAAGGGDAPAIQSIPVEGPAGPEVQPEQAPGPNQHLDRLVGDLGSETVAMLLDCFVLDAAELLQALQAAVDAQDRATIRHVLHTLKGSAGTVGFHAVADQAVSLMAADAVDPAGLSHLVLLLTRAREDAKSARSGLMAA